MNNQCHCYIRVRLLGAALGSRSGPGNLVQNLSIVPTEHRTLAPHLALPHLDGDGVATGGAGQHLALQLGQLRRTGRHTVGGLEPVAQHIAQARRGQCLQVLQARRYTNCSKVLHGQPVQQGLGLCPEDRKAEGIIAELSVRENIALALQARQGLWPFISRTRQTDMAIHYVKALGIKASDVDMPIGQLSGGNQQKAVLARWLATQPKLLILDEPTRGIDVAAKQEIMNEILGLAKQGMSVLFISSEISEVVRVADRIVVMRDHAKVGELPAGSTDHEVYTMIAEHA